MLLSKTDVKNIVPRFASSTADDVFAAHIENVKLYRLTEILDTALILALDGLTDGVDKPELRAFWENYVKRYFIWELYADFITQHGIEITQAGAYNLTSDNHQAISLGDRRLIIGDAQQKANYERQKMMNYYYEQGLKFDDIQYSKVQITAQPSTGGVRSIHSYNNPKQF